MRSYVSWYKYAVKAKRNKGIKNASHGLNPGRCRYWCHASNSLTEPATQQAHISISLSAMNLKFSQDYHQAIPSHSHFSHLDSHWERHSKVRHMAALQLSLVLLCSRYAFKREGPGTNGPKAAICLTLLCLSQ